MNASHLLGKLTDRFHDLTPHKDFRNYVGMSGIGGCLFDLYMRAEHNIRPDDRLKWYGLTGQLHEAAVKRLLGLDADAMRTFLGYPTTDHEIIADFDDRYRGHYDAVLPYGTLIEIKSTNAHKFKRIRASTPDPKHVAQCQAYMRHGNFDHAILVYICRDLHHRDLFRPAPPFWTIDVPRDEGLMEHLDEQAQLVLAALDGDADLPTCTCGYCEMNWSVL